MVSCATCVVLRTKTWTDSVFSDEGTHARAAGVRTTGAMYSAQSGQITIETLLCQTGTESIMSVRASRCQRHVQHQALFQYQAVQLSRM